MIVLLFFFVSASLEHIILLSYTLEHDANELNNSGNIPSNPTENNYDSTTMERAKSQNRKAEKKKPNSTRRRICSLLKGSW